MHTIVERKTKSSDFSSAARTEKLEPSVLGCAIVGFGILPTAVFAVIGNNAFGFWGMFAGAALGVILFSTIMLVSRKQRAEQKKFIQDGDVQEITVDCTDCFEIDLHNTDPILAFDIGLGKVLVLQGQWLMDVEIYGRDIVQEDPHEEFVNGLPHPDSFPNESFSIVRNPANGDVIAIRPSGQYLKPEVLDGTLYADSLLPQSQLISGTAGNLIADILRGTDLYEKH